MPPTRNNKKANTRWLANARQGKSMNALMAVLKDYINRRYAVTRAVPNRKGNQKRLWEARDVTLRRARALSNIMRKQAKK